MDTQNEVSEDEGYTVAELAILQGLGWEQTFWRSDNAVRREMFRKAKRDLLNARADRECKRNAYSNDPDLMVRSFVLRKFARENPESHLSTCPSSVVVHESYEVGPYGCATGCEHTSLSATVMCPHGRSQKFEYGRLGDLSDVLDSLIYMEYGSI